MKKTNKFIGLSCLLLVCLFTSRAWGWTIDSFTSEITLGKDSTLTVNEDITVDFQSEAKHGIYRDIPVRYKRGAVNYNLRLKVISVTDENGTERPYETSRKGAYLSTKIGDPSRYLRGIQTYNISYQVERGINYFDDHDELYWNVTGDEWDVSIGEARALIYFPDEIDKEEITWKSFTGPRGSTSSRARVYWQGPRLVASLDNIGPREGLTIVISLPKGHLVEPSIFLRISWLIQDNGFFLVPVIAFLLMFLLWFTRGRNPKVERSIMVKYHPPSELTPSEAGTLMDERVDLTDITAMVIDLAVRGYMKIKQTESTKLLFMSKKDYHFTLLKKDYASDRDLKKHELSFLMGIFESGKTEVALSSLKNKFHLHLPSIRNSLYQGLTKNGYFSGRPDKMRKAYMGFGVLLIIGGIFLTRSFGRLDLMIAFPLSGAILIAFSFIMPRLSVKGVLMLNELLGLKEFINRAEKDRLERLSKEDPTIFDRILPYAMVMGVADEWAESFKDLYREPPGWYQSSAWPVTGFYTALLVADLGEGLRTMGTTFSSSPSRTSAASGGSGFSGGFSGGGFGGGGGGSW